MKFKLIIPASGTGSRFNSKTPKQFLKIGNSEIITLTISKFHPVKEVDEIIIATAEKFFTRINSIIQKNNFSKVKKIVKGGRTRQDSVYNALTSLECRKDDIIIIHDSVRPFISKKKIEELISEAKKNKAVIPGVTVFDTVKKVNKNNYVEQTLNREELRIIQTPQLFRYEILMDAFEKANRNNFKGTDESMIVERAGYKVKVIEGEKENIKITTKEDLK